MTEVHGDEAAADLVASFSAAAAARLETRGTEEVKTIGDALILRTKDAGKRSPWPWK